MLLPLMGSFGWSLVDDPTIGFSRFIMVQQKSSRGLVVAEGPRDALCQLAVTDKLSESDFVHFVPYFDSCQQLHNCTRNRFVKVCNKCRRMAVSLFTTFFFEWSLVTTSLSCNISEISYTVFFSVHDCVLQLRLGWRHWNFNKIFQLWLQKTVESLSCHAALFWVIIR